MQTNTSLLKQFVINEPDVTPADVHVDDETMEVCTAWYDGQSLFTLYTVSLI